MAADQFDQEQSIDNIAAAALHDYKRGESYMLLMQ